MASVRWSVSLCRKHPTGSVSIGTDATWWKWPKNGRQGHFPTDFIFDQPMAITRLSDVSVHKQCLQSIGSRPQTEPSAAGFRAFTLHHWRWGTLPDPIFLRGCKSHLVAVASNSSKLIPSQGPPALLQLTLLFPLLLTNKYFILLLRLLAYQASPPQSYSFIIDGSKL